MECTTYIWEIRHLKTVGHVAREAHIKYCRAYSLVFNYIYNVAY